MAVIGTFTRARDGGWEGPIRTLTTTVKVRFVPNDNRTNDAAPDFHVTTAKCEVGAAWVRRRTTANEPKEYLSVQLDDPSWASAISAALFYGEDGQSANLVWTRRSEKGTS